MKATRVQFGELCRRLRAFEEKYGYSTIEFHARYSEGELGDDPDMMEWVGLYHLYLTSLPVRQFTQTEPAPA